MKKDVFRDFCNFAKKEFNIDIIRTTEDKAETFYSIFGISMKPESFNAKTPKSGGAVNTTISKKKH